MTQGIGLEELPHLGAPAHAGLELRHLRYLVAVADAGTFTYAAERMFIAQPTLSQQIRRLEGMGGTPLLHPRRDRGQLTEAGSVLFEESRAVTAPAAAPLAGRKRPAARSAPAAAGRPAAA